MIGQAINRVDGPLKVTGRATYAYEHWEAAKPLYGFILGATIGKGRITGIDTSRAEDSAGVRTVITHRNAPAQGAPDPAVPSQYWRAQPVLTGPEIRHYGQPVALVVAESFEQARAAAKLVDVEYFVESGNYDFAASQERSYMPHVVNADLPCETKVGDFETGFSSAAVKIDQRYTTPYQFSQPMEPNACLAVPRGEDLVIYVSAQIVDAAHTSIASTLQMDPKRIQIVDPYVGGGFGSKLGIHSETILAAIAARMLREPVKVVVTRQQIFHLMGVRPTTSQRVRLGAGRDGRLIAIAHEVNMYTSPHAEFAEQTAATVRALYAAPNRYTNHWLTPLDLPRGRTFGRLERRRGLWRWNRRWTNWRMRWGWTRSSCGSRTSPRFIQRRAYLSASAGWWTACAKARGDSAGSGGRRGRRACGMAAGWWAMAWRRRSACTSKDRPRHEFGWKLTGWR